MEGNGADGRDAAGRFVKGHTKRPGAGRGPAKNADGLTIKQGVLAAYRMAGGPEYLLRFARGNVAERVAFLSLCSKLIPTEITGELKHALEVVVVEREKPAPAIEHVAEPQITYEANE